MVSLLSVKQSLSWTSSNNTLIETFQSSQNGLSHEEAKSRIRLYGANELSKKRKQPPVVKFLLKFLNPLILILIFASILTAILGDRIDFLVIVSIVIVSSVIDFYQEHQAEEAAEKLSKKVALKATVLREGKLEEIPVAEIAMGDIISLSAGNIVPADARLIESKELLVSQSALTGESFPQEKHSDPINKDDVTVTERTNCIFMGTHIISGEGIALVVRTGSSTEFGKIAKELTQKRPSTEFQIGVKNFGILLMKITFVLCLGVFLVNSIFKHNILDSLLFAVALAVGLTPELLPLILTINLSKGAIAMSKKEVIVKYLPAIQNFGSMNVLCTDKTGTLTEDKIKLERYEDINAQENKDVLTIGFVNSHFQSGIKSPLDKAVLEHKEVSANGFTKVDEIPFDFERRCLSVVVKTKDKNTLITKGAPESIIHLCSKVRVGTSLHTLTSTQKEKIAKRFEELSSQGFRVLALATKEISYQKTYSPKDEEGMTFLGLMAFLDPAKDSAAEALKLLSKQGISLKILTGDNELVTKKVCEELGLEILGVTNGSKIKSLSDQELVKLVKHTTIFARLDPEQKERIILALKKEDGDVVGFLGDGINDAESLRAADIGISVNNAVDVAKESADLILLRKDLHVLKDGVFEGRKTYANIMKFILMAASSNFGNIFSVASASLFLPFLPMLPVQILLNNLLYDVAQITLSQDSVDPEFLEKPRKWNIGFIRHFMYIFGPASSSFDFLTFFLLLVIFKATVPLFQTGWFVESLISQTLIVFAIRTRVIPFYKSIPGKALVISSALTALVGLMLPFSPMASIFSLSTPPITFYLMLVGIVILYFILVENAKKWFYQKYVL